MSLESILFNYAYLGMSEILHTTSAVIDCKINGPRKVLYKPLRKEIEKVGPTKGLLYKLPLNLALLFSITYIADEVDPAVKGFATIFGVYLIGTCKYIASIDHLYHAYRGKKKLLNKNNNNKAYEKSTTN